MAANGPPSCGAMPTDIFFDAEVNTCDTDVVELDEEPPAPLSNPTSTYKLFTSLYNTLDKLERDLYEFAASASFYIIRYRTSNLVKDFSYNTILFTC